MITTTRRLLALAATAVVPAAVLAGIGPVAAHADDSTPVGTPTASPTAAPTAGPTASASGTAAPSAPASSASPSAPASSASPSSSPSSSASTGTVTGSTTTTTTSMAAITSMFSAAKSYQPTAPTSVPGWTADFVDNFNGPLNVKTWGRYFGGTPTGTVSSYDATNAAVTLNPTNPTDGIFQLNTHFANGQWSSAGMSSDRGFSAVGGKWVIKAKFDRAYGVGYAFLLYPHGGAWPPEVDFAEGTFGGPSIMATLHYGTAQQNFQIQRWLTKVDMTQWHTYGVIIGANQIDYTIDGRVWGTVQTENTPKVPMWLGVQAGVKDCAKSTGECLSTATPTNSNISIDWIAHYKQS